MTSSLHLLNSCLTQQQQTNNKQQKFSPQALPLFLTFRVDFMLATEGAAHSTGAVRRRRERRLRAYLRYARMSVARALAENNHHSAPQRQTMARAGEEEHRDEYEAPRRQKPPPPQLELFQLFEEEPGGSRPPCLGEPRGHRRRSNSAPWSGSPTSYARCRFWTLLGCWGGIRWWRCCGSSTCSLSSRSSQCPRSLLTGSLSVLPFAVRRRQNSFAVQALGRRAAAALAEHIVEIPVPQVRWGGGGGLQGSQAGQNSTAPDVEQIVETPLRNRGLQGFRPGQGSTASSSSRFQNDADEGIQRVFRTFPRPKKKWR